jgi:NADPH-dependent 2,4-dienoyl-CoA reductase/sulfur reductase-like enzyme
MRRGLRPAALDRILIVGGGAAGYAAAEELRRSGFSGKLTVIGAEPYLPYDRTACSKGLLTGSKRQSDVFLPVRPDARVEWNTGQRAVALDPVTRTVYTDTGAAYGYDGLVIATGMRPVLPPGWPHGEPGLHTLHDVQDAEALRRDLREAERVVVVGAGLTGCETAYAVLSMSRHCTLVDSNPQVLQGAIGETAGRMVTQQLRHDGVSLRLGRRMRRVQRRFGRWSVQLDNGEAIAADVVVAVLGERPDTEWLAGSGIDTSDGIRCDEALRVVGTDGTVVDGIVAAGSAASWPNLAYGTEPMRCGHWMEAVEQGRAAAQSLLAGQFRAAPVSVLPRFWSEQGELRIQVCGQRPPDATEQVSAMQAGRWDIARAGVLVSYWLERRLVGMVAINAPQAFTAGIRMMLADRRPLGRLDTLGRR